MWFTLRTICFVPLHCIWHSVRWCDYFCGKHFQLNAFIHLFVSYTYSNQWYYEFACCTREWAPSSWHKMIIIFELNLAFHGHIFQFTAYNERQIVFKLLREWVEFVKWECKWRNRWRERDRERGKGDLQCFCINKLLLRSKVSKMNPIRSIYVRIVLCETHLRSRGFCHFIFHK